MVFLVEIQVTNISDFSMMRNRFFTRAFSLVWTSFCQFHVNSQYFQMKLTNRSESDVLDINIFKFFGSENENDGLEGRIRGLRKFLDLKGGGDENGGTNLDFELNSDGIYDAENDDQAQGQGENPEAENSRVLPTDISEMMTFGVKHENVEEVEDNFILPEISTFKNHDNLNFDEMSGAGSEGDDHSTNGIIPTKQSNRTTLMQDKLEDEIVDSSSASNIKYMFISVLILVATI